MADPMTPAQWRAALRAEGVRFTEHDGWTTSGRDAATGKTFGPVHGSLNHHTAGSNSLATVADNGRPGLPPPLAHAYLPKTGLLVMVSCHRANHAGLAARNVYDAILTETALPKPNSTSTVDGNDCLYGIEVENLGDGRDTYTREQYDTWVRYNAAICRHHGWGAGSVAGHLETSVEGKVDPCGPVEGYGGRGRFPFTMAQLRTDVDERLKHPAGWSPDSTGTPTPAEEDDPMPTAAEIADALVKRLMDTDGVYDAPKDANDYDPDPNKPGHYWGGRTVFRDLLTRVRRTDKAVADLDAKVEALALALAKIDPAALAAAVAASVGNYELALVAKKDTATG